MKKVLLFPAAASLLLLVACSGTTTTTSTDGSSSTDTTMSAPSDIGTTGDAMSADNSMSDDSMSAISESSDTETSDDSSSAATSTKPVSDVRVINVTADNFKFTPNIITVKKGEKVVVHLSDANGVHGFGSKDLGFNVTINPGETKDVTIPTDKAGTFSFRCTVPCGPGHMDMTGQIIIQEA